MYGLNTAGPEWLTLIPAQGERPALEMLFPHEPPPKALRRAKDAAAKAKAAAELAGMSALDTLWETSDAFSAELIRWSLLDWRGLGDEKTDTPLAPTQDIVVRDADGNVTSTTPGTITAFLASPRLFDAAVEQWVTPWVRRDAEKNGYAPLSGGTSGKATQAGDTATKSATRRAKGGAKKTQTGRGARTEPKSRKPTTESASGV